MATGRQRTSNPLTSEANHRVRATPRLELASGQTQGRKPTTKRREVKFSKLDGAHMKTITLAAALLLASSAAYADSYNFEIQGQKIRIEAPKNCSTLSCIKVSAPGLKNDDVSTTKTT